MLSGAASAQSTPTPPLPPTLVVLVAVDQMRADYLGRFADQWVGGFRRFYREGTVFDHALQDHASTETAPGHATILSGREPAHTAMVLNSRGVQVATVRPVLGHESYQVWASALRNIRVYVNTEVKS